MLTGAAALAAYGALGHNGGPPLTDEAEAASVPFFRAPLNPFTIMGANVAAWWAAKDYTIRMTDDGSGLISSWRDRVTGLAITGTTTARPTYGASSFNTSFPGLTFDGVANCLVTTTLTALPTGATAGAIMCICAPASSAVFGQAVSYGGVLGATVRAIRHNNGNDHASVFDGVTNAGSVLTALGPNIIYGDWSGTSENGYLNGVAFSGNPTTIGTLNTGTSRLRVGASTPTVAGNFFTGPISDVIVFSAVPSTLQRQQLEGWAAWNRWTPVGGIQPILLVGHPYYGAPP